MWEHQRERFAAFVTLRISGSPPRLKATNAKIQRSNRLLRALPICTNPPRTRKPSPVFHTNYWVYQRWAERSRAGPARRRRRGRELPPGPSGAKTTDPPRRPRHFSALRTQNTQPIFKRQRQCVRTTALRRLFQRRLDFRFRVIRVFRGEQSWLISFWSLDAEFVCSEGHGAEDDK